MRRLPSGWWTGWVKGIGVLEESGQRTDSVGDAHRVPYLRGAVGYVKLEVGAEVAELVDGDMVHDG